MKTVVVQGLGFVGAAMATAIASARNHNKPIFNVIGVDRDFGLGHERVKQINLGKFPIETNDQLLEKTFNECYESKNIKATSDSAIYAEADIIMVSINCDLVEKNGEKIIDLLSFSDGIKEIAENIVDDTLIIIESTIPPGTCTKIIYPIFESAAAERGLNINSIYLAHSYERVMPGKNYLNSIKNFWRVYSGINEVSEKKCEDFLSQVLNVKEYPLRKLKNTIASETAKLLENSYRAVNIAFIEEWSRFAEDAGFDLFEIIEAIKDRPTHSNILQPGFGVGGYCLTKDPLFAKLGAKDILKLEGHEFPYCSQAIDTNNNMPLETYSKLKKYFNGDLSGINILLLGITYKEDVSDTRFSPSEKFYNKMKTEGANIAVHDPMVNFWEEANIKINSNLPKLSNYNAIVLAVRHDFYKNIQYDKWINNNQNILFFDANNVLSNNQISQIRDNNCKYLSIGRG